MYKLKSKKYIKKSELKEKNLELQENLRILGRECIFYKKEYIKRLKTSYIVESSFRYFMNNIGLILVDITKYANEHDRSIIYFNYNDFNRYVKDFFLSSPCFTSYLRDESWNIMLNWNSSFENFFWLKPSESVPKGYVVFAKEDSECLWFIKGKVNFPKPGKDKDKN